MKQEDYLKYINLIIENKFEEAVQFRRSFLPNYIYKFYPLYSKTGRGKRDKRTFYTLEENKIWCSKLEHFNDPYEGIGYYFEVSKDTEINLAGCLRVASFTEEAATNISMWAYYTNNHKGFCVKYKVMSNNSLYDVNYIVKRRSQAQLWLEALRKTSRGEATEQEQFLIYEKYLTKHISWKNEKEYRIIVATEVEDIYGRAVDCDRVGLEPMKIYAGIECTEENKRRLRAISKGLGCGDIGECAINECEFTLLNE